MRKTTCIYCGKVFIEKYNPENFVCDECREEEKDYEDYEL